MGLRPLGAHHSAWTAIAPSPFGISELLQGSIPAIQLAIFPRCFSLGLQPSPAETENGGITGNPQDQGRESRGLVLTAKENVQQMRGTASAKTYQR